MGWAKHPFAVEAYRGARSEAYARLRKLAKAIREENDNPSEVSGANLKELAYALHTELRRFCWFRTAVGGQEDRAIAPFVALLLDTATFFQWRTNVGKTI